MTRTGQEASLEEPPKKRHRSRPRPIEPDVKVTANGKQADAPESNENSKAFWLMKAEQEDREVTTKSGKVINARFTIDDLKSKTSPEPWDGEQRLLRSLS